MVKRLSISQWLVLQRERFYSLRAWQYLNRRFFEVISWYWTVNSGVFNTQAKVHYFFLDIVVTFVNSCSNLAIVCVGIGD